MGVPQAKSAKSAREQNAAAPRSTSTSLGISLAYTNQGLLQVGTFPGLTVVFKLSCLQRLIYFFLSTFSEHTRQRLAFTRDEPPSPHTTAAMSFQYLRITKPSEYVAHVELNRPDKLNAFIPALWVELGQAFTQLSTDSDVRAIVLSGAGDRAFTAGLDVVSAAEWMGEMANLPDTARRTVYMRRHIQGMQDSLTAIEKCEKRTSSLAPAPTP